MATANLATCLWFDSQAEEAATLYCSLLPNSAITLRLPQIGDPQGRAFMVYFTLMGQAYAAMNGGPHYKLTPAASIMVSLETQDEIDRLWDALLDGGQANRCGWLVDRFGLSWQIVPAALPHLLSADPSGRVMQAMMSMVKFDIAALKAAAQLP